MELKEAQSLPEKSRYGGDCFSCVQKGFVERGKAPNCTFIFNVDFYVRDVDAVVTYGFKKGDLGRRGNRPGTLLQKLIKSYEDHKGNLQPFIVELSIGNPPNASWFVPVVKPIKDIPEDFYSGNETPLALVEGVPTIVN